MSAALRVDLDDPTPAYEQLRRQVVALMASGELSVGDRLPPLRQLAGDLGLAVGTVARTYRELESAGLIASRRGGGTRVVAVPDAHGTPLEAAAAAYAEAAVSLGSSLDQAITALRARWP